MYFFHRLKQTHIINKLTTKGMTACAEIALPSRRIEKKTSIDFLRGVSNSLGQVQGKVRCSLRGVRARINARLIYIEPDCS